MYFPQSLSLLNIFLATFLERIAPVESKEQVQTGQPFTPLLEHRSMGIGLHCIKQVKREQIFSQ